MGFPESLKALSDPVRREILILLKEGRMSEQIAIHWSTAGVANGFAHKAVAAFGVPLIFLVINFVLTIMRKLGDPKREGRERANAGWQIITWIAPALSVILVPLMLLAAMGTDIPVRMVGFLLTGIVLIVLENYLPKSRRNGYIGIKLPWTLQDVDNWNKTHRFAGYVYIAGGVLLVIASFLPDYTLIYVVMLILVIAALTLLPLIYSYRLSKLK